MSKERITSETEFLNIIDKYFPNRHKHILLGRGDDAAVITSPGTLCVSTDLFMEDVHFRRSYFRPEDIGYKALAVNLSDMAAMGARPLGFTLAITAPRNTPVTFWDRVMAGMAELASANDLPLVGGDLNRSCGIGLSVTIWGESGESGRFLERGKVQPGDILFVIGELGLAAAGLGVLEDMDEDAIPRWPKATAAHLRPTLHMDSGPILAGIDGMTGLMDVSDGLAQDLPRLTGPNCGAELVLNSTMFNPEMIDIATRYKMNPVRLAVSGGEDYALLGAVNESAFETVMQAVPGVLRIGRVTETPGLLVNAKPFDEKGFDHFR
ncbi:thiamine-phosphate kinase [Desulfovibrio inopinatus]|uniref:thiamine-phosphate kinase n=1 Tax=Desulfovibrio inopinatus TaxID=102109 RepID=UPI0003FE35AF|nr:thiamine-phosphate kinase [Desulfovibrio inopinatus]